MSNSVLERKSYRILFLRNSYYSWRILCPYIFPDRLIGSKIWELCFSKLFKGMFYPPGNSELMCHKLPQFPGKFFENSAQILYRQLFWVATKFPPWRLIQYTTMPSFIKFGSALQSLFPYYGHVIRSMEITAQVFDRTLWNLAWLYIESIFRVEI